MLVLFLTVISHYAQQYCFSVLHLKNAKIR
jgi:hypothetical protein